MLLNLVFAWVYWVYSLEACGSGGRETPGMRLEHSRPEPQPVRMKRMTTDAFCYPNTTKAPETKLEKLCALMKNLPVRVSSAYRGGFQYLNMDPIFSRYFNMDPMAPVIEFETPFEVDGRDWWGIDGDTEGGVQRMVLREPESCAWQTDMQLFTERVRTPMDDRKLSKSVGKLLELDGRLVDPFEDEILNNQGIFSLINTDMGGCLGTNFQLFVQILDPIHSRFKVVGLHSPALDTAWSQSVVNFEDQCLKHYLSQTAIQIG